MKTTRPPSFVTRLSFAALFALPFLFMAPVTAGTARATVPVLGAEEIDAMCSAGLDDWKARVGRLEEIRAYTPKGSIEFVEEWNRLLIAMDDVHGPVYLLSQVSPDEHIRRSAESCDTRVRAFNTDLYLNKKLYTNVRVSRTTDNVERKLRRDTLNDFEDAGITLMAKKQERMREIRIRLDAIQQEFSRNIRDNKTRVVFTPEQMRGLPEDYLAKIKRDASGNYLLDFSYPVYIPFMRYADDSEARRQYQFEFLNRGTPGNLELLQEAIILRHEMATLAGHRSYADYKLRRRMAKKPGKVEDFLDQVQKAIRVAERNELEDLRQYKARSLGISLSEAVIDRWDVMYWQEKVRKERFDVDQNELRRYFPTDAAVRWTLGISESLYGIRFAKADVPVWHEDVAYFDVYDKSTGERLGGIYLDLFPREGKYGHAAAFPVRGGSTLEGRKPISVLVTNFNRTGLDGNELETLLHEFGHVLHGVLSKTRYVEQSGTSVERDFVEAPSQMFEEWAHAKQPLAQLPGYCSPSCPAVDDALLKRINQARKYGKGTFYARQLLYARYDMALYNEHRKNAMALWEEMERKTLLGHTGGTQFPGQFNHTISGYAAGYYGYLWSEVLAVDMLSQFGSNLMNPQMGMRYRKAILERGGEAYADELVRAFLGRAPNSKAFYREITGNADE
ncbi:Zn-dependent oligopeptidase [Oxalobacter sp. OttesenSCG-928-P03]|nr:Zn-dependent oligopeptidase [Oxalobacter sp. OttesenSCG-928-P03]